MTRIEKAVILAKFYLAGMIGKEVEFSIGLRQGLGIKCASTYTNRGDHGCCDYATEDQEIVDFEGHKVIVAKTVDGHYHAFFGEVYTETGNHGEVFEYLDPMYFLGEIG